MTFKLQEFIDDQSPVDCYKRDPTLRFDVQPYGGIKRIWIWKRGAKWALEEFT